ncbi:GNAT family N-acetyltransferase [Kosmotoga pacifica]|uniref:GNAT family N-acetyltransferase n=1 Tax=Kosmotoga pacifica TaxID=1330330 RepID=UPI00069AE702|nr:GNAT family N-acetyltransferase [Kosmotoga pacifica]
MEKQYVTVEEISRIELLNLMNEAFNDYVMRLHWDLESLERDLIENDISLKDSAVLRVAGRNVGFFLVGFRGSTCRIGLMGVLREFRRSGLGLEMLDKIVDNCKWKGISRVILETPEEDVISQKFYKRYGFRINRDLVSLFSSLSSSKDERIILESLPLKEVQEIAVKVSNRFNREHNWYNDPRVLSHLKYNSFSGIKKDGELLGYCIWSHRDNIAYIMDFGPAVVVEYSELVKYIKHAFSGSYESLLIPWVPTNDITFSVLTNNGFNKLTTQKEMELRLSH